MIVMIVIMVALWGWMNSVTNEYEQAKLEITASDGLAWEVYDSEIKTDNGDYRYQVFGARGWIDRGDPYVDVGVHYGETIPPVAFTVVVELADGTKTDCLYHGSQFDSDQKANTTKWTRLHCYGSIGNDKPKSVSVSE